MNAALLTALIALAASGAAQAAPVIYDIDPAHTYPSFEADHMGISFWRGKFNSTRGTVTLDRAAGSGQIDVTVGVGSIDFGHDEMNNHAKGADMFDATKFPEATYIGRLTAFVDGAPTRVDGELTLHGVTKPLALTIRSFKCIEHPMLKRELCGADVAVTLDRAAFGIDAGKDYGFSMEVPLRIQVEAIVRE